MFELQDFDHFIIIKETVLGFYFDSSFTKLEVCKEPANAVNQSEHTLRH